MSKKKHKTKKGEKMKRVTGFKSMEKNSNILGVKIKNYGECGFCKDNGKIELNIPWEIWSKWNYISTKMKDKEWGGIYSVKENTVTDFKIPNQEVTGVEAKFKEELGGDGIVHSHHSMGAFHSGEDNDHCRNLYDYSIVLSKKDGEDEYVATKRVKLPCGGTGYIDVEISIVGVPDVDMSMIKEKSYEYTPAYKYKGDEYYENKYYQGSYKSYNEKIDKDKKDEHKGVIDRDNVSKTETNLNIYSPCEDCYVNKCEECIMSELELENDTPPFCATCDSPHECSLCIKLERYLENYPEKRDQFKLWGVV